MIELPSNTHHNTTTPLISVLMPVYNAAAFVEEAVRSILAQTVRDFECICIDDGSTDDSLTHLHALAVRDDRLRIVAQPNGGICAALNAGLAQASGRFIARMDSDDWCDPQRFARQLAHLEADPSCVAVGTWVHRTDPYGSRTGSVEPMTRHEDIDAALLRGDGSAMVHATLMIRREPLIAIGGWRSQHDWVEDLDLFLRLAEVGRLANVGEHLYSYRRHADSICAQHYEQMCQRIEGVLQEAYTRRGMQGEPRLSELRPDLGAPDSQAKIYRNWACHAIQQRRLDLARRHAWSAIRREPWKLDSWRVMAWAMAG